MWWEDQERPSVEAPIQDFLGIPFARAVAFESALFSNPEARSFNCFVPMPFRKRARIAIENQSPMATPLFYDVDVTLGDRLPSDLAYFHASWRRENPTVPKRDFEILSRVEGRGRFLGASVGVRPVGDHRRPAWFGEGELKIYLDGDRELPTLVGTGTEDLVGSAWGLGRFDHLSQGAILTEAEDGVWAFYRFHIADPVYFAKAIRVTLQQMAGAPVEWLKSLPEASRPLLVESGERFQPEDWPNDGEWQNFELAQDVCATAYWYQTLPSPVLPPLPSYEERMQDLPPPPSGK
jgi:hypothetical protein